METNSLKCFGVGDGWPSADRNHSAYLYQVADSALLIDCGEGLSRQFKASGLSYDSIDRIFLSHLHFDHTGGFFTLIQDFCLEGRKKELRVHAPADGIPALREILRVAGFFDEVLPFRLRFEPLTAGKPVVVGSARVTPFPTSHLAPARRAYQAKYPLEFAAFSFQIESAAVRVGHSADVGGMDDLPPLVEKPLDLFVCEMAHLQPEELFLFLQGRDIRRIAFVHLSRENRVKLEGLRVRATETLAPIDVTFPNDGDELAF